MSTQKTYVGVWALTMARTASGGYAQVYAGDPVTVDIEAGDLARLLKEGAIGVLEVEIPDAPTVAVFDPVKGGGIKETLAYVGDDPAKATAMLELEETRDAPRVTLVEKLEAVATAPGNAS